MQKRLKNTGIEGEMIFGLAKSWSFASYTFRLMAWNVKNGSLVPHLPYVNNPEPFTFLQNISIFFSCYTYLFFNCHWHETLICLFLCKIHYLKIRLRFLLKRQSSVSPDFHIRMPLVVDSSPTLYITYHIWHVCSLPFSWVRRREQHSEHHLGEPRGL